MSKRSRGDSLTGGTGDVSPQLLSLSLATSAANVFTELAVAVPIARFQQARGKSVVMEILKVYTDAPVKDNNPVAGGETSAAFTQLSTISRTTIDFGNPRTVAFANKEYRGAFTATGSYSTVINEPYMMDLTDGAGHGVLVATDTLFLDVQTTNFTATATFAVKILYRFKEVALSEYIGIVQGQQ